MKRTFLILIFFIGLQNVGYTQSYEQSYKQAEDSIDNYNYSAAYFLANECIMMEPKRDSSYTLRAYCSSLLYKYEQAYVDAKKAIELNPENAYAHYVCGMANIHLPISQSEQDSIMDYFTKFGNDSIQNILVNYKTPNGILDNSYYNYGKSINLFKEAFKIDTTYSEAIYMIGYYYSEMNQSDSALKYLTKAIIINPNQTDYFVTRGLVYKDLYQSKKSLSDFTKAIEIDPNNGTAYSNRAYLKKEQLDDQAGACQDLKKAQMLGSYSTSYYTLCK